MESSKDLPFAVKIATFVPRNPIHPETAKCDKFIGLEKNSRSILHLTLEV